MPDVSNAWYWITRFGDSTLLLPLAIYLAAALWRAKSLAVAMHYFCTVVVCGTSIIALKILFMACGSYWGASIFTPSGHAGMAFSVYGMLAVIFSYRVPMWQRPWLVGMVAILVCAVAVSRVALSAHSVYEVAIGLLLGALSVSWFAWRYARLRKPGRGTLLPLLAGSLVVLAALQYTSSSFEDGVYDIALKTRAVLRLCPASGPGAGGG